MIVKIVNDLPPIEMRGPLTDGEPQEIFFEPDPNVVQVNMTVFEAQMFMRLSDNCRGTLMEYTVQVQTPWVRNIFPTVRCLSDTLKQIPELALPPA